MSNVVQLQTPLTDAVDVVRSHIRAAVDASSAFADDPRLEGVQRHLLGAMTELLRFQRDIKVDP